MIAIPKQQYKIEFLFPLVILFLSGYNIIVQSFSNLGACLSALVSLIGITGVLFYFRNNKLYTTFIFIWSLAQLVVIETVTQDPDTNVTYTSDILNLTQGYQIFLKLNLGSSEHLTAISFNILSIIYLGLTGVLSLSALYGSEISVSAFREETTLKDILPAKATIETRVTLTKEKNWLLIKLQPKEGQLKFVENALIKPKDNSNLKLKKKQVVYFLLVPDISIIKKENNSRDDFPEGDWAVVS